MRPSVDLRELALRAKANVIIKDRMYRLHMYERCFVAAELVDWMLDAKVTMTRAEAVEIGQNMTMEGLIRHVVDFAKPFDDAFLFFRFSDNFGDAHNVHVFRLRSTTRSKSTLTMVHNPDAPETFRQRLLRPFRKALTGTSSNSHSDASSWESHSEETSRLERLHAFRVHDMEPSSALVQLLQLALDLCHCPMAMLSFVDEKKVLIKEQLGLPGLTQMPREGSFCALGLSKEEGKKVFVVPDALLDARFAANVLVTSSQYKVRFYAGAPLLTEDGFAVGMLAVLDTMPRVDLPVKMSVALQGLGRQVMRELNLHVALDQLQVQRKNVEALLCNVLPGSIALRLLKEPRICDEVKQCTCCFIDLVGFTAFTESRRGNEVVAVLDALFTSLDMIITKHGVCKIKTIGDGYFFASGVPEYRPDHVVAAVHAALDCVAAVLDHNRLHNINLGARCGLACGPAIAGVVGNVRFAYDLWGSTVNLASRVESNGAVNEVTISPSVANALIEVNANCFDVQPWHEADIKGIGPTLLYRVRLVDAVTDL